MGNIGITTTKRKYFYKLGEKYMKIIRNIKILK